MSLFKFSMMVPDRRKGGGDPAKAIRYFAEFGEDIVADRGYGAGGYVSDGCCNDDPVIVCLHRGSRTVLDYVLKHADVRKMKGRAIHLHEACRYRSEINREDRAGFISAILRTGADVNGTDKAGRTALETSFSYYRNDHLDLLLARGATLYRDQALRIAKRFPSEWTEIGDESNRLRDKLNVFWMIFLKIPPAVRGRFRSHFFETTWTIKNRRSSSRTG